MKIKGIEITGTELIEALKNEENKSDFDVLAGANLFKSEVTGEDVENYLGTEAGKNLIQPRVDSAVTKGIQSWQTNNIDKIKEDAVSGVKEEMQGLVDEANSKVKSITISSKFRNQLLAEGLRPERLDHAIKLTDVSKISLDGENLIGATDSITGLKESVSEWFGEAEKPKGQGNGGNPPGQGNGEPGGSGSHTQDELNNMSDADYFASIQK